MPTIYSAASAAVPSGRIHFDRRVFDLGDPVELAQWGERPADCHAE